jgi:sarcosine oxidase, subunit beta
MAELPKSSDVVVVGGGVMGAAALHYLADLGCGSALLVERHTLASGSTGHCAGGVRTLFSDELNARIGLEAIARLERFPEELGAELNLRLYGYLFLLDAPSDVEVFERAVELQQAMGVDTRFVDPLDFVSQLETDDLLAAAFCPRAGYVTPDRVVQGYARRAAERGATIVQSCAASAIVVEAGRAVAVETARGRVATDRVVLTAGVWSGELAATAGLELPLEAERRHMFFTDSAPGFVEEIPLTIDFSTGFYFHREGSGLAVGGREQSLEELAPVATRRLPALAELGFHSSFSGLYELSPDRNALVGEATPCNGLVYATGFSGHGFQQGPVIGEHLARLALGFEPVFDLTPFAVERFAGGRARVELGVV